MINTLLTLIIILLCLVCYLFSINMSIADVNKEHNKMPCIVFLLLMSAYILYTEHLAHIRTYLLFIILFIVIYMFRKLLKYFL